MQKILLTNKNSVWGIIVNPQSGNVYKNIISFPNKNLRDEFINKELCDGEDYKTLIEKQPYQSIMMGNSSQATIMVNLKDYPNETMSSMLNKDFAIVKEEDGTFKYYACTSEISDQSVPNITFNLELDVFFTYDIKNMFNDNECEIEQAHEDRFSINSKGNITPMLLQENWKKDKTKGIYLPEKLGEHFTLQNKNNTGGIVFHLPDYIKEHCMYDIQSGTWKEIILGLLTTNSTSTICSEIKSSDTIPELIKATKTATKFNGNKQNYITNFFPSEYSQFYKDNPVMKPLKVKMFYLCDFNGSYLGKIPSANDPYFNFHIQKADVIGNTLNITPNNIMFNLLVKDNLHQIRIKGNSDILQIRIEVEETDIENIYKIKDDEQQIMYFKKDVRDGTTYMIPSLNQYPSAVKFDDKLNTLHATIIEEEYPNWSPWKDNYKLSELSKKDLNNEIKADCYPFRKIIIKGATPHEINIDPLYLFKNNLKFDLTIGNLMMSYEAVLKILDYNNNHQIDNYDKKGKGEISVNRNLYFNDFNTFFDKANFMGSTTKNGWNEYISRHKAGNAMDFKTAEWNKTKAEIGFIGAGVGAIGAGAAGSVMGTFGSLMGMVKSGFDIKDSMLNIERLQARNKDIKNSPNSTTPTNNDGQLNLHIFSGGYYLYDYKMLPQEHILVQEHFYKYGHNFNHKLYKLNDFLSSRYYFNYIKTAGCFELFKLQISTELKQVIASSLADGIHIWHYRSWTTWKGVKNFENENIEMNIANERRKNDKNKKNNIKKFAKNFKQ